MKFNKEFLIALFGDNTPEHVIIEPEKPKQEEPKKPYIQTVPVVVKDMTRVEINAAKESYNQHMTLLILISVLCGGISIFIVWPLSMWLTNTKFKELDARLKI